VKVVAAIAVAAGALALTAASSSAGAARGMPYHLLGIVPHHPHASRFASPRRTSKAAGFNCVTTCSSYESTINQYFTDVAADSVNLVTTNVYSVATQYSNIQYNETFGGSYVDGNPLPSAKPTFLACQDGFDKYCVTDAQLENEIGKVIAKNHWPTASPTTLYFIFTPANIGVCQYPGRPDLQYNPCTTNVFCAYHRANASFIYAVEPDAMAVSGGACDSGEAPAGNGADATINTISHEQNEAITDPNGDAWVANDGPNQTPQDEIGDLCAYDFGTPLGTTPGDAAYNQVINTHDYYLQLEYSNAADGNAGGCVPYLGGPVTAPQIGGGVGPLVFQFQDASVMTTNTVYAIYWVPAAPVSRTLPTISGAAKVGKKLTVSHGSWSHLPKFTYRWLRCSSAGRSCKAIAKATGSSHVLAKADKGHRLEVRVTATNDAGSAHATSKLTRTVKT